VLAGASVAPATTVRVGTELVKIAGKYDGPGLPESLCPLTAIVRDHRGLEPWEDVLFQRAETRLGDPAFFGNPGLAMLRAGKIPFAKCRNPHDGNKLWGRYYDVSTGVVETKPIPPAKCGKYDIACHAVQLVDDIATWVVDTIETFGKLGGQLLQQFADIVSDPKAFLDAVVDAFKMGLCAMLDSEWKRKLLQAGAILVSLPPSATEIAIKICRALCALLRIIEVQVSNTVKAIAAAVVTAQIIFS
jgi:hypothetical protein